MNHSDRAQQIQQAEEILGDRLQAIGFAKGLYFGQYHQDQLLPYPRLSAGDPAGSRLP